MPWWKQSASSCIARTGAVGHRVWFSLFFFFAACHVTMPSNIWDWRFKPNAPLFMNDLPIFVSCTVSFCSLLFSPPIFVSNIINSSIPIHSQLWQIYESDSSTGTGYQKKCTMDQGKNCEEIRTGCLVNNIKKKSKIGWHWSTFWNNTTTVTFFTNHRLHSKDKFFASNIILVIHAA